MYTIKKMFSFSASHTLNGLEPGHQCGRVHGHNYIVTVELKSYNLDDASFVLDYGKLKPIADFIEDTLEHRHLNDIVPGQPSAENIAKWLFYKFKPQFPLLFAIEVKETDKTSARYEHEYN